MAADIGYLAALMGDPAALVKRITEEHLHGFAASDYVVLPDRGAELKDSIKMQNLRSNHFRDIASRFRNRSKCRPIRPTPLNFEFA